jgi:hypothetical protein
MVWIKAPPKIHAIKTWSPEWLYREVMELLGGRVLWEVLGHRGNASKGNCGTPAHPLSFGFQVMKRAV